MSRGDAASLQTRDEVGAGDAPSLLLGVADEVDLRDQDEIRRIEALREAIEQESGSTVLVRLEDAQQATRPVMSPQRLEGRPALGGVMSVVVDDEDFSVRHATTAERLHAPLDSGKVLQARDDSIFRHAQTQRENRGGGGVVGRVLPGHRRSPSKPTILRPVEQHPPVVASGDAPVRVGAISEGLDLRRETARHAFALRELVVDQQASVLGQALRERRERLHDLVQIGVGVEVVLLDVVDQRDGRMVVQEGSPVLAGLRDQQPGSPGKRAMGHPIGADPGVAEAACGVGGAEAATAGADDDAWIESRLDEEVAEQTRGGALPVGAGDADARAVALQFAEGLRVGEDRHPGGPGGLQGGVFGRHRRGGDDRCGRIGGDRGGGLGRGRNRDAQMFESCSIRTGGAGARRAGEVEGRVLAGGDPPARGEHRGEAAHARSGDAHEVEATATLEGTEAGAPALRGGGGGDLGGGSVHEESVSVGSAAPGQKRLGPHDRPRLVPWRRMNDLQTPSGTAGQSGGDDPPRAQVLIVDDELDHAEAMADALRKPGHVCTIVGGLAAAEEELRHGGFDVVVTDLVMEDEEAGLRVLELARTLQPEAETIMVTAHGDVPTAKAALQGGAYDFIEKPLDLVVFRNLVGRAAETVFLRSRNRRLQDDVDAAYGFEGIIGSSPAIREVVSAIRRVAPSSIPVLVTGESGTGKELVAAAIHRLSKRAERRFVTFNAAGQSESLLEDQLFGHVRGAFTGADRDREGVFEYADRGTVFLDEIGDMPLAMQPKLLRVLETGEIIRLGSNEVRTVDLRLVSATNRDLKTMSTEGGFREDLYFRIRGVEIHVPPLRDRREDIPLLVSHAIGRYAADAGRERPEITQPALMRLIAYRWPGNVRELFNLIHRMVVSCEGDRLDVRDVPPEIRSEDEEDGPSVRGLAGVGLDRIEKEAIRQTLALTGGNREQAALLLGIGERTLYRKLKEYGLR